MRTISTYTLLLAIGGCAATTNAEMPPPDMATVKRIILAHKNQLWKDPDSVRSTSISPAFQNSMYSFTSAWLVCVRSNARNSFGGYTGESDTLIALNGMVPEVLFDKALGACGQQPHEPFPELEKKKSIS